MVMLTAASAIANSPLLPAGLVSRCRGRAGHYGSGPRRVCADRSVLRYDMRLVGLGARFSLERRKPFALVTGSSRMQSASVSFCFECQMWCRANPNCYTRGSNNYTSSF